MNFEGLLKSFFIILAVVVTAVIIIFSTVIYKVSFNKGYKKGQIDYSKGIIKYEVMQKPYYERLEKKK